MSQTESLVAAAPVIMEGLKTKKVSTYAIDAGIDFTAGTLGGVVSVLVGQPLDTIKVGANTCCGCLVFVSFKMSVTLLLCMAI